MSQSNEASEPHIVKELRSQSGARILIADNDVVHSPGAVTMIALACGRIAMSEYRKNPEAYSRAS